MFKKLWIVVLCFVMVTAMFAGCSQEVSKEEKVVTKNEGGGNNKAEDEVFTLKYSYIGPEVDPEEGFDTIYANTFKEYVEKESDGRIIIQIYPAGQLGNFTEMIQGAINGNIELSSINAIPLNNFYEDGMILGMPGAFESIEEANAVFDSEWAHDFYEDIREETDIRVLTHYTNGFRHFTNSKKLVKTVDDVKGLTFRTMESPVSIKMVEAMGAKAVPIPSSEMYVAMQNGVVDGQENPISAVIQDLTYEVQDYMVLDGHFASSMMTIMSDVIYEMLPEDLRQIIMDGSVVARDEAIRVVSNIEEKGLKTLEEKGMQVYTPTMEELKEWHNAYKGPTEEYIRKQIGDEKVDAFIGAIEEYRTNQ